MKIYNIIGLVLILIFSSCNQNPKVIKESSVGSVDELHLKLEKNILDYRRVLVLDHHRMAKTEGAYTPEAIASVFIKDDIKMYKPLLKNQQLAMDLPFKMLSFTDQKQAAPLLAYTSSNFIKNRHGLNDDDVRYFDEQINLILNKFNKNEISLSNDSSITKDYGIVKIKSNYNFTTTLSKVRNQIKLNQDTRWFGEIDFQKESKNFNIDIRPTFLCFFGAPKPGALAMHTTPKIGLDAFCQKLLIYEDESGDVYLCFSDIAAISKLYYNTSTKPQDMITNRMKEVLINAVE